MILKINNFRRTVRRNRKDIFVWDNCVWFKYFIICDG